MKSAHIPTAILCLFASCALADDAPFEQVAVLRHVDDSTSHVLGATPYDWRGIFPQSAKADRPMPWTHESRAAYEAKMDWFHKAKYGVAFCFMANIETLPHLQWTSESWNAAVDAVDVEKFADQARQAGAGYVILSIGQNCQYYCAPNPLIEKYWELAPSQYGSKRDLPMDLSKALARRGIPMMLYMATDHQFNLPRPASMKGTENFEHWIEVMQWYSDHYGKACAGWWIDGLCEFVPGYIHRTHEALRHGNPDAITASGTYGESDFIHGHCGHDWGVQKNVLPYFGRWDPEYRIQMQVFQYIGGWWSCPGVAHTDADMVEYAKKTVQGGGVITFDLGVRNAKGQLAFEIPQDQLAQLLVICDALKDVPVSDGAEMRQETLQRLLMKVEGDTVRITPAWPKRWTDTFTLRAPKDTTIEGRVERGILTEINVTPAERRKDVILPPSVTPGNLALCRPARFLAVTADHREWELGPWTDHTADLGVDGDPAGTGAAAGGYWGWTYEVDLEKEAVVSRVVLTFNPKYFATQFHVSASVDGKTWATVLERKDQEGAKVDAAIEPTKARYLRVTSDKPDDANQKGIEMEIQEFEAYQ